MKSPRGTLYPLQRSLQNLSAVNGTSEGSTSSTVNIAAIVSGSLGGVVLLVVILLAVVLHRRRHRSRSTLTFSQGPLQVALPVSKEAFTSRNHSTYGFSFYSTDPNDTLTRLPPLARTRTRRY